MTDDRLRQLLSVLGPAAACFAIVLALTAIALAVGQDPPRYDRDAWPHWSDADRDCMNTRHEVLTEESLIDVATNRNGCAVLSGEWLDPFSGDSFSNPRDLDVDHIVPLAYAFQAGGWAWSREERRAYANDMTNPSHLVAVSASLNRQKGAKGPAEWMPPNEAALCWYAEAWLQILARYELRPLLADARILLATRLICGMPEPLPQP